MTGLGRLQAHTAALRGLRRLEAIATGVLILSTAMAGIMVALTSVPALRDVLNAWPPEAQWAALGVYCWVLGASLAFAIGVTLAVRTLRPMTELAMAEGQGPPASISTFNVNDPDVTAIEATFRITTALIECCRRLDAEGLRKLVQIDRHGADVDDAMAAMMMLHLLRTSLPDFDEAERAVSQKWLAENDPRRPPNVTIN